MDMMSFILGFIAGAVAMLIVDFFVDRRIEAQRKSDQEAWETALKERKKTLHSQEMITR